MRNLNLHNTVGEKPDSILFSKYFLKNLRLRIGLLLLIFSLLLFGKRNGWIAPDFFEPLVMLTLGLWFIITYFMNHVNNKYNNWTSSLKLNEGDYYGL